MQRITCSAKIDGAPWPFYFRSTGQPQTIDRLVKLEIMGLNDVIILQYKVDCIKEDKAVKQYEAIRQFLKGTKVEDAPIVRISAQLKCYIDVVCEYTVNKIAISSGFYLRAKDELKGGVPKETMLKRVLTVNQMTEIRPRFLMKDDIGDIIGCRPIVSRVVSLYAEHSKLEIAVPGLSG